MQIGIGTSKGIGIGTALVLKQRDVEVKVTKITDTVAEKARFEKARDFLVERTKKMTADMTDKLGKTAEILRNQIVLAGDQEAGKWCGVSDRYGKSVCRSCGR